MTDNTQKNDNQNEDNRTPEQKEKEAYNNLLANGGLDEYGINSQEHSYKTDASEILKEKMSTFSSTEADSVQEKPKKSFTQKQTAITIFLSCFVIVVIALVFALGPLGIDIFNLAKDTGGEEIQLLDGEVLGSGNSIMMFEHIERNNIQSIEVHNSKGEYTAYYNKETESFTFYGAEMISYNNDLFSSLVTSAGYTLTVKRLDADDTVGDLSQYGLSDTQNPAYFILTTRTGEVHKVYIGEKTLVENGYYVRYEGRNAVYILDSTIETTLLAGLSDLLSPLLTHPITDTNSIYTGVSNFIILKDEELFAQINYTGDSTERTDEYGTVATYSMIKPSQYAVNDTNFQSILDTCANLQGDKILEINVSEEITEDGEETTRIKPEIAEKYGLSNPKYKIFYVYDELVNAAYFSEKKYDEKTEEYYYYAFSPIYDIIVRINADRLSFFEWDMFEFVDTKIFNVNINKISEIEVITSDKHYDFKLVNKTVDGKEKLVITEQNEKIGFKLDESVDDTLPTEEERKGAGTIYNFRQFYKTMLLIRNQNFTDEKTESSSTPICQMTVKLKTGRILDYKFYAYSDRRCFYTLTTKTPNKDGGYTENTQGEFYVLRSMVKKLASDAQRIIDGQIVDSESAS